MLVGRSPEGSPDSLQDEVDLAMASPGGLTPLLAEAAGRWPGGMADALAHLALRCANPRRRSRPALDSQVRLLPCNPLFAHAACRVVCAPPPQCACGGVPLTVSPSLCLSLCSPTLCSPTVSTSPPPNPRPSPESTRRG